MSYSQKEILEGLAAQNGLNEDGVKQLCKIYFAENRALSAENTELRESIRREVVPDVKDKEIASNKAVINAQSAEIEALKGKLAVARDALKSYSNCNPSPVVAQLVLSQLDAELGGT